MQTDPPRPHVSDEARQAAIVTYDNRIGEGSPQWMRDAVLAAVDAAAPFVVAHAWSEWVSQAMAADDPPIPAEVDDLMRIAFDNGAASVAVHRHTPDQMT